LLLLLLLLLLYRPVVWVAIATAAPRPPIRKTSGLARVGNKVQTSGCDAERGGGKSIDPQHRWWPGMQAAVLLLCT